MIREDRRVITLTEYQPQSFAREEIPTPVAEALWRDYRNQVTVEFPSIITGNRWQLTAQGWVGFIPLSRELGFALRPKVPLRSLFTMLDYAFDLRSFHILDGLYDARSLPDFYERLALLLAQRTLDRCRRGLYHAYIERNARLPFVRGQIQAARLAQQTLSIELPCHYAERTADNAENGIVAYALHSILHSGLCTARTLPTIRRALRGLHHAVTLRPYFAQDCRNRRYDRLNDDYRVLHALSSFFLDERGPGHEPGTRAMVPFLIDMARLYERFLAEWLRQNIGHEVRVQVQERHIVDGADLHFTIDLVLYDAVTGAVRCVLDTKYKTPAAGPAAGDVAQIVTYAEAKGAEEALLVYPVTLPQPLDAKIGKIRVRSLTFALEGDIAQAGQQFLTALGRF